MHAYEHANVSAAIFITRFVSFYQRRQLLQMDGL
jgi:hypothetical protein